MDASNPNDLGALLAPCYGACDHRRMAHGDDVAAIVRNPDWFPYRYDPTHDAVHFVRIGRSAHRAAAFLRDECLPDASSPLPLGREESIAALNDTGAPVHFIFHSAYCCSTLLARAFDIAGVAMGLKEPLILNDMVGWNQRERPDRARIGEVLDHSLRLLARPFEAGETTIIKPSNIANDFIDMMLGLRPAAKALLLYAPLETYLPSIVKKGLVGRHWVRTLLISLINEQRINLGFTPEHYLALSDLQVAAIGWIAQQAQFHDLVRRHGHDRIATLNSERLIAAPRDAMTALDRLFGTALSEAQIDAIVTGPAFRQNSKTFTSYGVEDRDAANRSIMAAHAEEIEWVTGWAIEVARANAVPLQLGAPLIP